MRQETRGEVEKKLHRTGIEPVPLAWKASMITASPSVWPHHGILFTPVTVNELLVYSKEKNVQGSSSCCCCCCSSSVIIVLKPADGIVHLLASQPPSRRALSSADVTPQHAR